MKELILKYNEKEEFSTEESHIFVNGMLDRIYKDLVEEKILFPEISPIKEG